MTVEAFSVGNELGRLIDQGFISRQALTAITGISSDSITKYLTVEPGLSVAANELSDDETRRVTALTGQLTDGLAIEDDVRLRAIIETLTIQYQLSNENLARLTHTHLDDLEAFLSDPAAATPAYKYELAIRVYYVFHAVLNALPDPSHPQD